MVTFPANIEERLLPVIGQNAVVLNLLASLANQQLEINEASNMLCQLFKQIGETEISFAQGGKIVTLLIDDENIRRELHQQVDVLMGWSRN